MKESTRFKKEIVKAQKKVAEYTALIATEKDAAMKSIYTTWKAIYKKDATEAEYYMVSALHSESR